MGQFTGAGQVQGPIQRAGQGRGQFTGAGRGRGQFRGAGQGRGQFTGGAKAGACSKGQGKAGTSSQEQGQGRMAGLDGRPGALGYTMLMLDLPEDGCGCRCCCCNIWFFLELLSITAWVLPYIHAGVSARRGKGSEGDCDRAGWSGHGGVTAFETVSSSELTHTHSFMPAVYYCLLCLPCCGKGFSLGLHDSW